MNATPTPLTDKESIAKHEPGCRRRARIELEITRRVINDLVANGYKVAVSDGEDYTKSDNIDILVNAVFAVDEAQLSAHNKATGNKSFVSLVMGNEGHDIISDYGVSLESIIAPIFAWIEEQQASGNF